MKKLTHYLKLSVFSSALLLGLLAGCKRQDTKSSDLGELHTVTLGDVSESILVSGVVRPTDIEHVENAVGTGSPPGVMLKAGFKAEFPTMIYRIPEGTKVQKGDLLFEVQSSNLELIRYERDFYLNWANSNYIEWRERLKVEQIEVESYMMDARKDLEFSQDDLVVYVEGDSPLQLQNLKDALTRATNRAEQAHDEYRQSIKLAGNGYINPTELEADKLLSQERQMSLELAQSKLNLFEHFTYPREVLKMERQVELNKVRLLKTQVTTQSSVANAQRNVNLYTVRQQQYKERLDFIEDQIASTKVYAPIAGTVIYAASNGAGRVKFSLPPPKDGDQLFPTEDIIHIIYSDRMHLIAKIMEKDLYRVQVGQAVKIGVEAMPGRVFMGKVSEVGTMAIQSSMFMNPELRQYEIRIDVEGTTEGMQPGMSCVGEIISRITENILTVPVQCITKRMDTASGIMRNVVYVSGPNGVEQREVSLGLRNALKAEITSGLSLGDQVLLKPLDDTIKIEPSQDAWVQENIEQVRRGISR